MVIIGLHPEMDPQDIIDAWGYIPSFLQEDDPRPAAEQFNDRYGSGWWPIPGATLKGNVLKYPGDPAHKAIALIQFNDEVIMLFPHAMVAIVQADESFEVARMD